MTTIDDYPPLPGAGQTHARLPDLDWRDRSRQTAERAAQRRQKNAEVSAATNGTKDDEPDTEKETSNTAGQKSGRRNNERGNRPTFQERMTMASENDTAEQLAQKAVVHEKLRAVNDAVEERKEIEAKLQEYDDKIAEASKTQPKGPQLTVREIEEQLARLHREQESSTVTLQEEKARMRRIDELERSRSEMLDSSSGKAGLRELRAQKGQVLDTYRLKQKEIDELRTEYYAAELTLRMLPDASESNEGQTTVVVDPKTLAKVEVTCDTEEQIQQFVGTGASGLIFVEKKCQVILQPESRRKTVKIYGLPHRVAEAEALVRERLVPAEAQTINFDVRKNIILVGEMFKSASGRNNVAAIEAETGTRVSIDRENGVLTVSGPASASRDARMRLEKLLNQSVVETIDCPSHARGAVIACLREIQDNTRTRIDCLREENKLVIVGVGKKRVQGVVESLQEIINGNSEVRQVFEIKKELERMFIGTKGANIQRLRDETGAMIRLENGTIAITGKPTNVSAAREAVEEYLIAHDVITFDIPVDNWWRVLGKDCCHVREAESEFDVIIRLDQNAHTVTICGRVGSLRAAAAELQSRIQQEETITISPAMEGSLVGPGGANITRIQADCNVSVSLKKGTGEVKVRGPQEGIDKAVALIRDATDLPNVVTVHVPEKNRPKIVGKSGHNLMKIESEFGVSVRGDRKSGEFMISGSDKDSVKRARKAFERLVEDSVTMEETIDADAKLRGGLIGKGGEGIRRIVDESGAFIRIDRDTGKCVIRGSQRAVKKAKELVQQALEDSEVDVVDVAENMMAVVIGKEGATIKTLEERNGARLDLDRENNRIRIIGKKENRYWAKLALENLLAQNTRESVIVACSPIVMQAIMTHHATEFEKFKKMVWRVYVDRKNSCFKLTGAPNHVADAERALTDLVNRYSQAERVIEDFDPERLGDVIGRKGAAIRDLEKETNTAIMVDKEKRTITVLGKTAGVRTAHAKIEKILSANATGSYKLSEEGHIGIIIGQKGRTLRDLRDHTGCIIDIDRENLEVNIRGTTEGVEEAKRVVEYLIHRMTSSTTKSVFVSGSNLGRIIGKSGENLRRLQELTGVMVNINREVDGGDRAEVVFKGLSEDIEYAMDALDRVLGPGWEAGAEDDAAKGSSALAPAAVEATE